MIRSRQLGTARSARVSALVAGADAQIYVLMMCVREKEIETEPVQTHKIGIEQKTRLRHIKLEARYSVDYFYGLTKPDLKKDFKTRGLTKLLPAKECKNEMKTECVTPSFRFRKLFSVAFFIPPFPKNDIIM